MRLPYLQQGFGSELPLVLLHPFPLNAHFWSNQLAGFSKDRHVIAPNFRGYSSIPLDPQAELSIERFAGDVRKTLQINQIDKAVFAGCSLGGYVLFELWRQQPDLVAGFIFADTRAEADTPEQIDKRMQLKKKIEESGTRDLPDVVAGFLSEHTRRESPEVERTVRSWAEEPEPSVIIKSIDMLAQRPDSVSTLSDIDVPTLVLVGSDDQVTPKEAAQVIADNIAGAELKVIPDAGHLAPLENPVAVNDAIREFLPSTAR